MMMRRSQKIALAAALGATATRYAAIALAIALPAMMVPLLIEGLLRGVPTP